MSATVQDVLIAWGRLARAAEGLLRNVPAPSLEPDHRRYLYLLRQAIDQGRDDIDAAQRKGD